MLASAELFPLLGVSPIRGRFYTAEESAPGSPLTAVVSEEYWRSAYGADPGVLGRSVEVSGRAHTIIGVAPAGFTGIDLGKVDFWLPLEATHVLGTLNCLNHCGCYMFRAVSRVKPDVSMEAAEAEATRLVLNGRRGDHTDGLRLVFGPVIAAQGPQAAAESRMAVWLVGVSVIVLLIACANVANLLMARGTRQQKEVALRIALGAASGRVVGQMMVESVRGDPGYRLIHSAFEDREILTLVPV